jgi:hypothetical protein
MYPKTDFKFMAELEPEPKQRKLFNFFQCWGLNPGPYALGKLSTIELHS